MGDESRAVLSRPGWLLLAWALAFGAQAGSFTTKPIRLTLAPGASSATLTLENPGAEPVLVQAEIMAWSQNEGSEVLDPSEDLIVSPPVFTIAPGAAQIVRVGLLRPVVPPQELSYRLFLQEVPPPPEPGHEGVGVSLRVSLPVFILPRGNAAPAMSWSAARGPEGAILLTLANAGNAHVQAIDCTLHDAGDVLVAESNLGGYVLPGQSRTWTIHPHRPWSGGYVRLTARTDAGESSARLEAP